MAFGAFDRPEDQPMAEINTTPLVDVMLVLLVIFMVTAPLFTHAVRIDLPQARSQPHVEKPDAVGLSLDAAGVLRWNGEAIDKAELTRRLQEVAALSPQPQVHLRAHRDTRYQRLAEVMSEVQIVGIRRLGFVTDPTAETQAQR